MRDDVEVEVKSVTGCNHKVQVDGNRVWVCGAWFPVSALQKIALAILRAENRIAMAPVIEKQAKEISLLKHEKHVWESKRIPRRNAIARERDALRAELERLKAVK